MTMPTLYQCSKCGAEWYDNELPAPLYCPTCGAEYAEGDVNHHVYQ